MKKQLLISLIFALFSGVTMITFAQTIQAGIAVDTKPAAKAPAQVEATNTPKWINAQLQWFRVTDERYAYSRPLGWGTGVFQKKRFYWFAMTNSDGLASINMSITLDVSTIMKIEGLIDRHNNSFEVLENLDAETRGPETMTRIDTSNDWIDTDKQLDRRSSGREVIGPYIGRINHLFDGSDKLNFEVIEGF